MSRAPSFSNRAPPLTVLQFLSASFIAAPALFSDFISSLPPLPLPRLSSRRPRPRPAYRRRRIGGELRDCPGDFIALINMAANANSLHVMTVIAHARRNAAATQRRNAGQRRGGRSEARRRHTPSRAAPHRAASSLPYLWHVNVASPPPPSKGSSQHLARAVRAKYEESFLPCGPCPVAHSTAQPTHFFLSPLHPLRG